MCAGFSTKNIKKGQGASSTKIAKFLHQGIASIRNSSEFIEINLGALGYWIIPRKHSFGELKKADK